KQIQADPVGYDHNFVVRGRAGMLRPAARATAPRTGIVMEMRTTEPGVQFYSGNFLDGTLKAKDGTTIPQYGGFCLEAQHYPDSVNHPEFPPVVVRPGQTYSQTT